MPICGELVLIMDGDLIVGRTFPRGLIWPHKLFGLPAVGSVELVRHCEGESMSPKGGAWIQLHTVIR